jgi:hypothetical protein
VCVSQKVASIGHLAPYISLVISITTTPRGAFSTACWSFRSEHIAHVSMRIGKPRGNWKSPRAWLRKNATESRQPARISMDNDFIQQFVCSDCRHVYGEILALDSHPDRERICPRCGACNGAVLAIECIYDAAWASLMRL